MDWIRLTQLFVKGTTKIDMVFGYLVATYSVNLDAQRMAAGK
jgi:hypothetical protein